jgi:hypothetical protein
LVGTSWKNKIKYMVKSPEKPKQTPTNTINGILSEKFQRLSAKQNKTTPKPRKQIYQENYQKNKEKKKAQSTKQTA